MLKSGDTWNTGLGNWILSGESAQDPMVIGSYGTGARPELLTGNSPAIETGTESHPTVDNLDIMGINFDSISRDPSIAGYSSSTSVNGGILEGDNSNILVENCEIQNYTQNISMENYYGPLDNVSLRRNEILDAYSVTGAHSEGIYSNGVNGLTIQDNVLDHNGWSSVVPGAYKTIFNHDCYISADNSDLVVTGNIFSNASSHGLQARCGGIVENNLFINDAIAMSYGLVNGSPMTPGGVSGAVSGNVIVGGNNIGSLTRGGGIELGNIADATVTGNLFADGLSTGMAAIELEAGEGVFNPTQAVGINDLTITDNTVYNWAQGVSIASNITPGTSGLYGLNDVTISKNDFQDISAGPIVIDLAPLSTSEETFSGNTYNSSTAQSKWMNTDGKAVSWVQHGPAPMRQNAIKAAQVNFPDSSVSVASYDASIGDAGSIDAFLANARSESSQDWQSQYTAAAVNAYMRAGFSMAGPTAPTSAATPAPTPTPTPKPSPAPTTSTPKPTPAPTSTPKPTPAPTPTSTPKPTPAPTPTSTAPKPKPAPTPTSTPKPTPAPTPTSTPKPTPAPTPTPTPKPAPAPAPAPTPAETSPASSSKVKKHETHHVLATVVPPKVTRVHFHEGRKGTPERLEIRFNIDVASTIQASDLVVTGPNGVVPASAVNMAYNAAQTDRHLCPVSRRLHRRCPPPWQVPRDGPGHSYSRCPEPLPRGQGR